jgi:predicted RNase H-like nuclease (RuvC/YqgF family)
MAQRKVQRTKQVQATTKTRAATSASGRLNTVEALRAECERLTAELEAARSEIAELTTQRDGAINRIDWVLDSLKTLLEAES